MTQQRAIATPDAPKAIGPYSQGVVAGDLIFCSGQIPLDPETGDLVEGTVEVCVDRIMQNLAAVLAAEHASLDDIVKTTIYLADLDDFPAVNAAYGAHFTGTPPARATVQVARLPLGVPVEIDAIALRKNS